MSDMEGNETLAEYVKRVRQEKRFSLTDVERNSRRQGPGISNGYVSQIENGQMTNPSLEALRGLAVGLGVSEDELFAVARGKKMSGELSLSELNLVEQFRQIPDEFKAVALRQMESLRESLSSAHNRFLGSATGTAQILKSEPMGGWEEARDGTGDKD